MAVCLCSARRCWLFPLEWCCVSATVTTVSSANVISCSVGCESISFQGTITEDSFFFCPFFPIITFESNHCALLHIHFCNQNTSAAQCCDHVTPMTSEMKVFAQSHVSFSLHQFKTTAKTQKKHPQSFYFSSLLHCSPDLGELWFKTFTLGCQTTCWMDRTKTLTFSNYSHEAR